MKKDEWVAGWLFEWLLLAAGFYSTYKGQQTEAAVYVTGYVVISVIRMIEKDRRKNG